MAIIKFAFALFPSVKKHELHASKASHENHEDIENELRALSKSLTSVSLDILSLSEMYGQFASRHLLWASSPWSSDTQPKRPGFDTH